jgi:hypothetical protein
MLYPASRCPILSCPYRCLLYLCTHSAHCMCLPLKPVLTKEVLYPNLNVDVLILKNSRVWFHSLMRCMIHATRCKLCYRYLCDSIGNFDRGLLAVATGGPASVLRTTLSSLSTAPPQSTLWRQFHCGAVPCRQNRAYSTVLALREGDGFNWRDLHRARRQ